MIIFLKTKWYFKKYKFKYISRNCVCRDISFQWWQIDFIAQPR
jgi:hypothetical protein